MRLSGNFSSFMGPAPLGLGRGPCGVGIYYGGSVSPGILNYLGGGGNLPLSRTETGTRLSGNSISPRRPAPLGLGRGPFGVGIYQGGPVSHGISNYLGGGCKSAPIENGNWYAIVWKLQLFPGSRPH